VAVLKRNELALMLGASLCWAGPAAAAQPSCTGPIEIEAKPFEVDYRNNNAVLREVVITQCEMRIEAAEARVTGGLNFENSRWTISGNVRITAEGGRLSSDKAVVSFRDNVISHAEITGAPAEFEQQRDDGTTSRGHANIMEYETDSGAISFRENAWLSDGRNEISGPQLVYNVKTQSVQGQGKVAAGKPGTDRIRIVIQPRKPGEKAEEKKP
jgi:lipopolysaccharide transport protein LptA